MLYSRDGLYTATEVRDLLSVDKWKFRRWTENGIFPKCIKKKADRAGVPQFWPKHEVHQWIVDNIHLIDVQEDGEEGINLVLPERHERLITAACRLLHCTPETFILDAALTKAKRVIEHYDLKEGMEACVVGTSQNGRLSRNSKTRNTR